MRIALLAPPGVQSLDIVGPAEVFWEAARRLGDPNAYNVQVIAGSPDPVRGTGGLRFVADRHIFEPDEPIDTLLVGGDPSFATIDPAMVQWLRRRAGTVRRLGSVCTGVFLLATAGLLEGKRVTTHWECAARLRKRLPEPERRFGSDLHQGWQPLYHRRGDRRDGPRPRSRRGGLRTGPRTDCGALHGHVPKAPRRSVTIQRPSGRPNVG